MKCPKCQHENPRDSSFCGKCATRLEGEAQPSYTKTLETPAEGLMRGTTFAGRYEIIEELGAGGMGRVYRAQDRELCVEVALKLINPEIAADKKTIDRFKNELKLARNISHRNVGRMYELMEERGNKFISMEYVRGEDLKSFLKRAAPLSPARAVSIARQICDGLEEAHRRGVIHRDLKPSNIMIDNEGSVRIMDFGIARSIRDKSLTAAGVIIGTPEYMSPEQMDGKETDERSDIYSLGVVLYEMVTGRLPFEGDTPLGIALKHKGKIPPDPKKYNPQIHGDLSRLIKKCLEKAKHNRYQNAEAVARELVNIETSLSSVDEERLLTKEIIPVAKEWTNSIAVLPLDDLSPQRDQEYFCDGLAEELINALTKIEDLRVVARTSSFAFKGKKLDIREIGRKLGVATILEGSVRKSGDRLRITAQLIDVGAGHHLWSERYDRDMEDVFAVQDEIAVGLADKLKASYTPKAQSQRERHSDNLEAYDLYLKGRYYWNKFQPEMIEKLMTFYEQAIEKDPQYALAYAALAEAYTTLSIGFAILPSKDAMPEAREAALKALEIDPNLAEAHMALALVATCYDWDPVAAERSFRKAIELNPNCAAAHLWFEICLTFLEGKFGEAISELERALELDPLNLMIKIRLGFMHVYTYDYDRAIGIFKEVVDLEPDYPVGHLSLGNAYGCIGRYDEGIAELKKAIELGGRAVACIGGLGYVFGVAGKKREARELIDELEERSKKGYVSSLWIGAIWLGLGDYDKALDWLHRAYEERDSNLIYLTAAPPFDPLFDHPRTHDLLRKMGLEAMIDKQALIQQYRDEYLKAK